MAGTVAIVAVSDGGTPNTIYDLTGLAEAETAFGAEDRFTNLISILFANGATRVLAIPVTADWGYDTAISMLRNQASEYGVDVMTCDSGDIVVQQALQYCVEATSTIGVVGCGMMETPPQAVERAGRINSSRMVLVSPAALAATNTGAMSACAVAAVISACAASGESIDGKPLSGLPGLMAALSNKNINQLASSGVTPLIAADGQISIVRAVTTDGVPYGRKGDDVYVVTDATMTGIANAIRAKADTIAGIKPSEFAAGISAITTLLEGVADATATAADIAAGETAYVSTGKVTGTKVEKTVTISKGTVDLDDDPTLLSISKLSPSATHVIGFANAATSKSAYMNQILSFYYAKGASSGSIVTSGYLTRTLDLTLDNGGFIYGSLYDFLDGSWTVVSWTE